MTHLTDQAAKSELTTLIRKVRILEARMLKIEMRNVAALKVLAALRDQPDPFRKERPPFEQVFDALTIDQET